MVSPLIFNGALAFDYYFKQYFINRHQLDIPKSILGACGGQSVSQTKKKTKVAYLNKNRFIEFFFILNFPELSDWVKLM